MNGVETRIQYAWLAHSEHWDQVRPLRPVRTSYGPCGDPPI